ncbi:MAG: hypothetical protein HRU29_15300 [Rhizobiales bacterium]|nr:hypothetical protein [Hyphomicrobiales bacterium]
MSMNSLMVFGLVVLTGFICAGFLHSLYQLLTNRVMSFDLSKETGAGMIIGLLALIFAGPFVIMRNSIRGFIIDNKHGGWVAASTAISIFWSFVSGMFLLNIYMITLT